MATNLKTMVNTSIENALNKIDMSAIIGNSVTKALEHMNIESKISTVLEQRVESYVEDCLGDAIDEYVERQLDCYDVSETVSDYLDNGDYLNDYEVEEAIENELDNRDVSGEVSEALADKVESVIDDNIGTAVSSWLDNWFEIN